MEEIGLVKTIGEFGSIGVTLALVFWLIPKIIRDHRSEREEAQKGFQKIISNHLKHAEKNEKASVATNEKLAVSLDRLTGAIKGLRKK